MARIFAYCLCLLLLGSANGCAYSASGYETPESMIVDPDSGAYFVSNINGDPFKKDGNGYISRISPGGAVVIQKFIGGKPTSPVLDAPKGLWIRGNELFVADIDRIKVFDKQNGKEVRSIDLSPVGAKFLNDLVMDGAGHLYASDTIANAIYLVDTTDSDALSIYREGDDLGGPNGLVINPRNGKLTVATWLSGEILEIERGGKIHHLKRGLKMLDGIDYDVEGTLYVAGFQNGEVYRIPFFGRGTLSVFETDVETPADISCDRKRHELLIPSYQGNAVHTKPLFLKKKSGLKSAAGPEEDPPDEAEDGK